MKIKRGINIFLVILFSAGFILLGVYSVHRHLAVKGEEARTRLLQKELLKADAILDNGAAVAAYKKLSPPLPEIQLRVLERQWRIALELLQYMRRAGDNAELQEQTDVYNAKLKALLDEMLERCGQTLADGASLSPDITWRLHNAAGSARVLKAFIMLEGGENLDKVQGVMRDALTDYKAAIEAVDKAGAPPLKKNIPRWNFEVLNGEEYIQKFEVAMTDTEKNQLLKENLETLLPEMGGYGPGEPIETIVKK